jgi:hypothetical protein
MKLEPTRGVEVFRLKFQDRATTDVPDRVNLKSEISDPESFRTS